MEETDKKRKITKLISDLESGEERKVIGALKRIPHEGSPEVITPMLQLLVKNPSPEVRILLEKTLYNLKDPATLEPLAAALNVEKFRPVQADILAFIWQSGLDASPYISLLVDVAIQGEYMTAVEALTIADSLEDFQDNDLTESIKKLDKATEVKSEKSDLLGNLRQILLEKLLEK